MGNITNISWCDSSWNPWIGCTKVGPGCDHCYAETLMDKRHHRVQWGSGNPRSLTSASNWKLPLRWNKAAFMECCACKWRGDKSECEISGYGNPICPGCHIESAPRPARRRVFCASLADVFDNEVDEQWRADLFHLMAITQNLDWIILTKRVGNVPRMLGSMGRSGFQRNQWIGATVVNQEEADRDIPKLLDIPAYTRFLSIEPMLGPISLDNIPYRGEWLTAFNETAWPELGKVHWVIAGGESGHQARASNPDWYRSLRDQCAAAQVPFHFKQWGEWGDGDSIEKTGTAHNGWWEDDPEDGGVPQKDFPGPMSNGIELASQRPVVYRVGKRHSGRFLDGIEHNGFPS